MRYLYSLIIFSSFSTLALAQTGSNPIQTAVPFLTISPDARSGAMGDAGVALSPDVNSQYWNASKLAFLDKETNFSLSYSPWLRNLVSDVSLANLNFSQKLDDRNTIGASLRYFNLGTLSLYDDNQNPLGTSKPVEFAFDVSLARKFSPGLSLGLAMRYIHSNLSQGIATNTQYSAINALAADISMFSTHDVHEFGNDAVFAFGVNISNIGPKVNYVANGPKYFLPTNLKIGAANTWLFSQDTKLTLALDLNKLLVPTPPLRDNAGNIISGKDDNRSVVSGIFGSFSDAPGGTSEELQEITYSTGAELWFHNQFALRGGYFYENPNKGNRQFYTLGAGFRYANIALDFSYLFSQQQYNALANTLRFSLGYNLDGKGKK
ncbi:type IX secretion system outer membrane channel protein PorV [Mucilaginibacter sp. AW1-3]